MGRCESIRYGINRTPLEIATPQLPPTESPCLWISFYLSHHVSSDALWPCRMAFSNANLLTSFLGCIAIGWAWRSGKIRIGSGDQDFTTFSILSQVRQRYLLSLFFFVLIALQFIRMGIHVWFLPPYVWDTLTYHLPNVAEWVQNYGLRLNTG